MFQSRMLIELKPARNTDCEIKFSVLYFHGHSVIFELKPPFNVDFNEYLRYLRFTDFIIFLKLKQRSLWNVSKVLEYCVFFLYDWKFTVNSAASSGTNP